MTDFDIDIDDINVREALDDLRDDWGDAGKYVVESAAEYSIYIEFGRGPISAGDNIRGLGNPGPQIPGGISGDEPQALRFKNEDGEVIYRASVSGHPPYPFFRPAIREFKANPEAFLLKNTEFSSLDSIDSADEMVRTVALALESQMKVNANANRSGRSPGTHPEHPVSQTGNMIARIQARRIG